MNVNCVTSQLCSLWYIHVVISLQNASSMKRSNLKIPQPESSSTDDGAESDDERGRDVLEGDSLLMLKTDVST